MSAIRISSFTLITSLVICGVAAAAYVLGAS